MGNAKIWYYPDSFGPVVEIDLGGALSDNRGPFMHVDEEAIEGGTGRVFSSFLNGRVQIPILVEGITDWALKRQLENLINHLKRRGTCFLAEDADLAIAGYLEGVPYRNQTNIKMVEQPWRDACGVTGTLASGDEVVIQTASNPFKREVTTVSTNVGNKITLSKALLIDYQGDNSVHWVMVRHHGFYPALRLPMDAINSTPLRHDHRISFTLDIVLEEAIDVLDAMSGHADVDLAGSNDSDYRPSMDDLVNRAQKDNAGPQGQAHPLLGNLT
jgi:hypothetical protein